MRSPEYLPQSPVLEASFMLLILQSMDSADAVSACQLAFGSWGLGFKS